MGMTDKQFDSYKSMLLSRLREAIENGKEKEIMSKLVAELDNELRKP